MQIIPKKFALMKKKKITTTKNGYCYIVIRNTAAISNLGEG